VAAVIGHNFGSPVAAYCAVIRPDEALMSAPFGGPPPLPFNTAETPASSVASPPTSVFEDLARLDRPRKYYQQYCRAPQGIGAFSHGLTIQSKDILVRMDNADQDIKTARSAGSSSAGAVASRHN
jgi:hypothetical protein